MTLTTRVRIGTLVGLTSLSLTVPSGTARATIEPQSTAAGHASSIGLEGISCSSASDCTAVGLNKASGAAAIFATSSGGQAWDSQAVSSGTPFPQSDSCPTPNFCLAEGIAGGTPYYPVFIRTTDGGGKWTTESTSLNLYNTSVSAPTCSNFSRCYATEWNIRLIHSKDGGSMWERVSASGWQTIDVISCVRMSACFVVGGRSGSHSLEFGRISSTGSSVTPIGPIPNFSGVNSSVMNLSCSSSTSCALITNGGNKLLSTSDGGVQWIARKLPLQTYALSGLSCSAVVRCVVPATSPRHKGLLLEASTRDGGVSWTLVGITSDPHGYVVSISCPSSISCYVDGPGVPAGSVFVQTGFATAWHRHDVQ